VNEIKHMLIVEDDPNDIELTLIILEECELADKAVIVRTVKEAMNYLFYKNKYKIRRTGNPSVILLDLNLQGANGLAVLQQIKEHPGLNTIPVVMFTSSCEKHNIIKSYNLGANAYVTKPVKFEKYREIVKTLSKFWMIVNEPPL